MFKDPRHFGCTFMIQLVQNVFNPDPQACRINAIVSGSRTSWRPSRVSTENVFLSRYTVRLNRLIYEIAQDLSD